VPSREEYELKKLQVREKEIKFFGAKVKYWKLCFRQTVWIKEIKINEK
jgi:hypothetical protein